MSDRASTGGPLVVIAGPTASGKSAAALRIADETGAEIVSCDSVAVYRGFDIGAAKPSPDERARVPHHLIDVAGPEEAFTAARFVELADRAIADCGDRGVPVIVCGGTFLYLAALRGGLFEAPPSDPVLRARLKQEAARVGWPALHARLAEVDAEAAERIHPNDSVRIERALEVYEQTGVPISQHHAAQGRPAPRHPAHLFIIDPEPAPHDAAIAERVDHMLAAGLVEETRAIAERHGRHLKALGAVGYKEALAHLDGRLSSSELREAIRIATRRFGRRQRTWLRKAWPAAERQAWVSSAEALLAGEIGSRIKALITKGPTHR